MNNYSENLYNVIVGCYYVTYTCMYMFVLYRYMHMKCWGRCCLQRIWDRLDFGELNKPVRTRFVVQCFGHVCAYNTRNRLSESRFLPKCLANGMVANRLSLFCVYLLYINTWRCLLSEITASWRVSHLSHDVQRPISDRRALRYLARSAYTYTKIKAR